MEKLTHFLNSYNPKTITKPYLIAEAGVNHEGSMDLAKRLIDEAAEGGAQAIKFQTYRADTIASKDSPYYWDITKEPTRSQHELFKKYDKFWKKEYEELEKYTRALFQRGTELAADKGLILVDTKYEFGKAEGKTYLIDEIHTPDSSRYFYAEGFKERQEKGEAQKQLSKEFVRRWLIQNGFQGLEGQKIPNMTDEYIETVSERYIELYEKILGEKFVKANIDNIDQRIDKNVLDYLATKA